MKDKDWANILQAKLGNGSMIAKTEVWENVQNALRKKRSRKLAFWWTGSLACCLLAGIAVGYSLPNKKTNEQYILNSHNETLQIEQSQYMKNDSAINTLPTSTSNLRTAEQVLVNEGTAKSTITKDAKLKDRFMSNIENRLLTTSLKNENTSNSKTDTEKNAQNDILSILNPMKQNNGKYLSELKKFENIELSSMTQIAKSVSEPNNKDTLLLTTSSSELTVDLDSVKDKPGIKTLSINRTVGYNWYASYMTFGGTWNLTKSDVLPLLAADRAIQTAAQKIEFGLERRKWQWGINVGIGKVGMERIYYVVEGVSIIPGNSEYYTLDNSILIGTMGANYKQTSRQVWRKEIFRQYNLGLNMSHMFAEKKKWRVYGFVGVGMNFNKKLNPTEKPSLNAINSFAKTSFANPATINYFKSLQWAAGTTINYLITKNWSLASTIRLDKQYYLLNPKVNTLIGKSAGVGINYRFN